MYPEARRIRGDGCRPQAEAIDPSVTSPLCAANAAKTSSFSRAGTPKWSSERASSAATSSNSSGVMWRSRWASSNPRGVLPGLVAANVNGPPATLQTHRVRMNFSPGSLASSSVLHSLSAGFFDPWPTAAFCTTASLKWSTTAAIANTPPNRSYRLGSAIPVPPSPRACRAGRHVTFGVYGRHPAGVHTRRCLPGGFDEHALHRTTAAARDPQVVVHERLARVLLVAKPARQRGLLLGRRRHRLGVHPPVDLHRALQVVEEHERLAEVARDGTLDQVVLREALDALERAGGAHLGP